jgi:hypothetical protein
MLLEPNSVGGSVQQVNADSNHGRVLFEADRNGRADLFGTAIRVELTWL